MPSSSPRAPGPALLRYPGRAEDGKGKETLATCPFCGKGEALLLLQPGAGLALSGMRQGRRLDQLPPGAAGPWTSRRLWSSWPKRPEWRSRQRTRSQAPGLHSQGRSPGSGSGPLHPGPPGASRPRRSESTSWPEATLRRGIKAWSWEPIPAGSGSEIISRRQASPIRK